LKRASRGRKESKKVAQVSRSHGKSTYRGSRVNKSIRGLPSINNKNQKGWAEGEKHQRDKKGGPQKEGILRLGSNEKERN